MTQRPQVPTEVPSDVPVSPGKPVRGLALASAGAAVVFAVLGFLGAAPATGLTGALVLGGGLLVGAVALPGAGRVTAPGAVVATVGMVGVLQAATTIRGSGLLIAAVAVAVLTWLAAVMTALLDAGAFGARKPRPAVVARAGGSCGVGARGGLAAERLPRRSDHDLRRRAADRAAGHPRRSGHDVRRRPADGAAGRPRSAGPDARRPRAGPARARRRLDGCTGRDDGLRAIAGCAGADGGVRRRRASRCRGRAGSGVRAGAGGQARVRAGGAVSRAGRCPGAHRGVRRREPARPEAGVRAGCGGLRRCGPAGAEACVRAAVADGCGGVRRREPARPEACVRCGGVRRCGPGAADGCGRVRGRSAAARRRTGTHRRDPGPVAGRRPACGSAVRPRGWPAPDRHPPRAAPGRRGSALRAAARARPAALGGTASATRPDAAAQPPTGARQGQPPSGPLPQRAPGADVAAATPQFGLAGTGQAASSAHHEPVHDASAFDVPFFGVSGQASSAHHEPVQDGSAFERYGAERGQGGARTAVGRPPGPVQDGSASLFGGQPRNGAPPQGPTPGYSLPGRNPNAEGHGLFRAGTAASGAHRAPVDGGSPPNGRPAPGHPEPEPHRAPPPGTNGAAGEGAAHGGNGTARESAVPAQRAGTEASGPSYQQAAGARRRSAGGEGSSSPFGTGNPGSTRRGHRAAVARSARRPRTRDPAPGATPRRARRWRRRPQPGDHGLPGAARARRRACLGAAAPARRPGRHDGRLAGLARRRAARVRCRRPGRAAAWPPRQPRRRSPRPAGRAPQRPAVRALTS